MKKQVIFLQSQNNHNRTRIVSRSLNAAKYTVIFRVIAQGISVAATILLVRVLSEHDYGIYNLLYSIIALLGMVASFGIANTLQRYVPEYYSRGEFRIANKLYQTASLIRLFSNVVVLGIALIFWNQLAPYLKIGAYKHYFMLFTLIILLHMQREILEICLGAFFLQKYSQGFSVIFIVIKAVGYGLAFWIHLDLWFVLIVDLTAYAVVFALLTIIYYREIPLGRGKMKRFDLPEKRRISRYALFYNFNDAGAGLLGVNFDNFVIGFYMDPVAIGGYSFCQKITMMIARLLPINYLLDVIRPAFFSSELGGNIDSIKRNFQLLVKGVYLFQIPVFCFIVLFAHELISIVFKGKFVQYSPVLILVCLFALLNAFQMPVSLVAQLKERADIILYSKIFAVYNLIADVILIRFFGIWGAVMATGTATLGKNLFIWFFVKAEANLKGTHQFFVRTVLFWIGICTIGAILKILVISDLYLLILGSFLFGIAFILQFRFVHLSNGEKDLLISIFRESKKLRAIMKWTKLAVA